MSEVTDRPPLGDWECRQCGQCCGDPLMDFGPLFRDPDKGARFDTEGEGNHRYLRRREVSEDWRPCVYLADDGRCSRYDDRPLICQEWTCCEADLRWRYRESPGMRDSALALAERGKASGRGKEVK